MGWNIKVDDNVNGRQIKTTISRATSVNAEIETDIRNKPASYISCHEQLAVSALELAQSA
jgi:hypothetical protein